MHIDCPHCQNPIDLVIDHATEPITCPACGSSFSVFDPDRTKAYREQRLESIGRFKLIEQLGSGHFGDVWLAHDSTLDRQVAVKIPRKEDLDREDVERVLREARAAAQLQHPNIVHVHEIGKKSDVIFIVSELIQGANLRDWLTDHLPTPMEAARLCATIADALEHAHQAGVIHRDLKPANILMDRDGRPHITDFGLAKRKGAEITMTVDGHILGTPAYMSPEQARGEALGVDHRTDVYSLGVILFEMLTGQRPFHAKAKMMLIQQVIMDDPPRPRSLKKGVPFDLETICLKAMAKEPGSRYQTARELADDLRRYIEGKPIVARPVGRLERAWRWARRNRALASSLAAIAILMIAAGGLTNQLLTAAKGLRHRVQITTEPEGAEVVFIPLGASNGEPQPDLAVAAGRSPCQVWLGPGQYLVVAQLNDGKRFHEVYRRVPADPRNTPELYNHQFWEAAEGGGVTLPPITIPDESVETGMTLITTDENCTIGSESADEVPPHKRRVPAFFLDPTEVTIGGWKKGGRPVPAALGDAGASDAHPLSWLTWDRAVAYAESVGKRLPDEFEYERVATDGGRRKFPWGDSPEPPDEWPLVAVTDSAIDRLDTIPPVLGLYSNVAEWTTSWTVPYPTVSQPRPTGRVVSDDLRIVRGSPISIILPPAGGDQAPRIPQVRLAIERTKEFAGIGLRCARSVKPRLRAQDFNSILPNQRP